MMTKEELLAAFDELSDENKEKLTNYMRGLLNKEMGENAPQSPRRPGEAWERS